MSTTITATVMRTHKQLFTIETLQLDDIRPNEVRVPLVATGVCHTDAVVRDGIVEQVGAAVRTVKPGDHVVAPTPQPVAAGPCSASCATSLAEF